MYEAVHCGAGNPIGVVGGRELERGYGSKARQHPCQLVELQQGKKSERLPGGLCWEHRFHSGYCVGYSLADFQLFLTVDICNEGQTHDDGLAADHDRWLKKLRNMKPHGAPPTAW